MSDYIHPLIAGIIRELPKPGEVMPTRRKNQWMTAFEGILDLLYPEQLALPPVGEHTEPLSSATPDSSVSENEP